MKQVRYSLSAAFAVASLFVFSTGTVQAQSVVTAVNPTAQVSVVSETTDANLKELKAQIETAKINATRAGARQAYAELDETLRLLNYILDGRSTYGANTKEVAVALERIAATYDRIAQRADEIHQANLQNMALLEGTIDRTDGMIAKMETKIAGLQEQPQDTLELFSFDVEETSTSARRDISDNVDQVVLNSLQTQMAMWKALADKEMKTLEVMEPEAGRQQFFLASLQSTLPAYESLASTLRLMDGANEEASALPAESNLASLASKMKAADIRALQAKSPELFPQAQAGLTLKKGVVDRQWSDVVQLAMKVESARDRLLQKINSSAKSSKKK